MYVTCDSGLEKILAAELSMTGAAQVSPGHRGVGLFGDRETMWRVNLESRVANRVLVPVGEFPARNRDELYAGAARVDWTRWFKNSDTIAVDTSSHKSQESHTVFLSQVIKDAICDQFREATGQRPSVNRVAPHVRINGRLDKDHCILSIDASGDRLHRRGYRIATGKAPIKETLAAGILSLSNWSPGKILVDPMCGSGTFLIEAAMMAANQAPGLGRMHGTGFGFMNWLGHDEGQFEAYLTHLKQKIKPLQAGHFYGTDTDQTVLKKLEGNARRAGVGEVVTTGAVAIADFRKPTSMPGGDKVHVVSNPPYGERLASEDGLTQLYTDIGQLLKREFAGSGATLIVGQDSPHRAIGLRPKLSRRLRNGAIQCRLLELEIFGPPSEKDRQ